LELKNLTLALLLIFCTSQFLLGRSNDALAGMNPSIQVSPPDTVPPFLIMESDEYYPEEGDPSIEEEDDEFEEGEFVQQFDIATLSKMTAFEVYAAVWDTARINPYGLDLKTKSDTTMLTLWRNPNSDYSHPTCGNVTSEFGMRGHRYHYGIDLDLETGDAVVSAFEGTVRIAKYSTTYGYYVIVRHSNGLETLYAHLSRILVKSGDKLKAGDLVGLGGNTGRSRGSHLHFEVRFLGQQLDPRQVIAFEEYSCRTQQLPITSSSFNYQRVAAEQKAKIGNTRYYKVRRGDTLGKIAKKNKTTVKKICKLNKISTRTKLTPGRRIRVA